MNIIGHKNIFLTISAILVATSIAAMIFWGIKPGIDFTGGSFLEVEFLNERPSSDELEKSLSGLGLGNIIIQPYGEKGAVFRFKNIDEKTHREILSLLDNL
mgnify:FL=1